LLAGLLLAATGCSQQPTQSSSPPNVILIVVDDLGYGELGCYGGTQVGTPHLDALAAAGARFTRAYATASLCSPSRAGLLTGRYQQRFGHENNTGPLERQIAARIGLPPEERTLATLLLASGYRTALVGKWHLGASPGFLPQERGFEHFFGHLSGGHTYLDWNDPKNGPILRGTQPVSAGPYLTDALTSEAVDFVAEPGDAPFFLLLSYNAVHAPLEAPAADLTEFASIEDEQRRVMAAMIRAVDDGVGEVLGALERRGVAEDTVVVFLNDNGAVADEASDNGGLRAGKKSLYEGGIRVPMLARWPGRIAAGTTWELPVSTLDIVPTVLAAAGRAAPDGRPIDGLDLVALLAAGEAQAPARDLFWRQGRVAAVSNGELKLVRTRRRTELYDLGRDPFEEHDLAQARPEELAALEARLTAWEARMASPLWTWRDQDGGR
jgi:arylsulfatase A-like enzyme